jgi:hypothetical protein
LVGLYTKRKGYEGGFDFEKNFGVGWKRMREYREGIAPIIIILVVLALGAAAIVGAYAITSGGSTKPERAEAGSRQLTGYTLPTQVPLVDQGKIIITPKPSPVSETKTVKEESGVTLAGWKYVGLRDVMVYPSFSVTKKYIYVDFERESFSDVASIYYNLNYNMGVSGVVSGVEATFDPAKGEQKVASNGNVYIRKELYLGACSKGVCTVDENPRNFRLVVKTKRISNGVSYHQTLTKASL